jgi:putative oxidoreductase
MRSIGLLLARLVLGSYLAAHGTQKLFGWFGGRGLDGTGQTFEQFGLRPGKPMAFVAGATELSGGLCVATGAAYPLGPLALIGTMIVATMTLRRKGALAQGGGYELPLTNLGFALALLSAGPGAIRLTPDSPRWLVRLTVVSGGTLTAYAALQTLSQSPSPPEVVRQDSA